jgi:hypothetical protein
MSTKESGEAKSAIEEPCECCKDTNVSAENKADEANIQEGNEAVSLSEETPQTHEMSPNGSEESKEEIAVETVDSQEEDVQWEVSCCGVDLPLTK